jgi:hypothetical protein
MSEPYLLFLQNLAVTLAIVTCVFSVVVSLLFVGPLVGKGEWIAAFGCLSWPIGFLFVLLIILKQIPL